MSWTFLGEPPHTVNINNIEYALQTSYKTAFAFSELMASELDDNEKWMKALELYFDGVPWDIKAGIEAVISFFACGKSPEEVESEAKEQEPAKVIDFEKDMPFIYAAFLDQYQVDLYQRVSLHWWQFMAMFKGLRQDARIVEIMGYRSAKEESWMSKEQKAEIRRMHKIWDLDQKSAAQQQADADFLAIIQGSGDIAGYMAGLEE